LLTFRFFYVGIFTVETGAVEKDLHYSIPHTVYQMLLESTSFI